MTVKVTMEFPDAAAAILALQNLNLTSGSSSKSESSTTPKKNRTKAASESPPPAEAPSSTSAEATSAPPPSEKAAPAAGAKSDAGTSPAPSVPTVDEVRAALTQCQARNGGDLVKPREILSKYAPSGTLGTLKEEDRAKVIAECLGTTK
jgi:hypothetical protein